MFPVGRASAPCLAVRMVLMQRMQRLWFVSGAAIDFWLVGLVAKADSVPFFLFNKIIVRVESSVQ